MPRLEDHPLYDPVGDARRTDLDATMAADSLSRIAIAAERAADACTSVESLTIGRSCIADAAVAWHLCRAVLSTYSERDFDAYVASRRVSIGRTL